MDTFYQLLPYRTSSVIVILLWPSNLLQCCRARSRVKASGGEARAGMIHYTQKQYFGPTSDSLTSEPHANRLRAYQVGCQHTAETINHRYMCTRPSPLTVKVLPIFSRLNIAQCLSWET